MSLRPALPRMVPRDPGEPHRAASPLELFFDLVFVVSVSTASSHLHHALAEGEVVHGITMYAVIFFAIWWAWMNFTWFATSFDTDDWLYRATTVVQMAGVLILAAGIEPVFVEGDFAVVIGGYVVMRVAMISQWLRAARQSPEYATTARIYAAGIGLAQVLWLGMLLLPGGATPVAVVVLIALEISVPVAAERLGPTTPWHPHHITERYSLFTLILLGESLLASSNAIIGALHSDVDFWRLAAVSVLVLTTTASLWWTYFWPEHHRAIGTFAQSLRYGYAHYFVFAAAGAFSAGVEVEIDQIAGHSELGALGSDVTVSIPVAIFLVGIWWVALRRQADRVVNAALLGAAALLLLDPFLPVPFLVIAAVMVALVVVLVRHAPVPAPRRT